MKRWCMALVVAALPLIALMPGPAGSAADVVRHVAAATQTEEGGTGMAGEEEVRGALEGFYAALNAMFEGELEPMGRVWSHRDDVTYMGPGGGYQVGWTQVLGEWEKQAALKLGGKVEPKEVRITVGRDLAVVSNYEMGQNLTPGGKPQKVAIRATNLFRKENGAWKMIGHHTDLLPYLQK
jgi:ketosteroid isomerase-like protein